MWNSKVTQNSYESLLAAAKSGFSIETDFRNSENSAVIGHDPVLPLSPVQLNSLTNIDAAFALNIKEDGLQPYFLELIDWIKETGSFVFDGSIPDMYGYRELDIPHAVRLSEFEKSMPWESNFIWLDGFISEWWIENVELYKIFEGKQVIVVSSELHGRDHRKLWDYLVDSRLKGNLNFSICTDFPLEFALWAH